MINCTLDYTKCSQTISFKLALALEKKSNNKTLSTVINEKKERERERDRERERGPTLPFIAIPSLDCRLGDTHTLSLSHTHTHFHMLIHTRTHTHFLQGVYRRVKEWTEESCIS
jgi:hypothetical protein